jgi:hypothetical protein
MKKLFNSPSVVTEALLFSFNACPPGPLVKVEFKLTAIEIDADFPIVIVESVTFVLAVDSLFDAPSFKDAVLIEPFEVIPPLIDDPAAAVQALAESVDSVAGSFASKFPVLVAASSASVLCSGAAEPSTVAASESAPPESAEVDAEGIINYDGIFLNFGH